MAQLQGGGGGIPGKYPVAPTRDPLQELEAMLRQLESGGASANVDYSAQARDIYAPQFSYLDQLAAQAQNQAEASKKDIGGTYSSLQKGIYGQAGGIKSNYDRGISDVGSAYNSALSELGGQFDNTRNNSAEVLQRLGIQQAAPNVMDKSNQMEALLSGILGANNQATQNNLRQGKQSSLAFNTQQGNAAGLAGAEAQQGLARQLGDFLMQISGKKADLNSKVSETAFSMEGDAQKSALDSAREQYKRMIDDRDFNYRMGKDAADYELRARSAATGDTAKLDPMGKMQQLAMQLYGNPQSAGNAMKAITGALMDTQKLGSTDKPSLGNLLAVLKERLKHVNNGQGPGDWSSLERLAAMLYE